MFAARIGTTNSLAGKPKKSYKQCLDAVNMNLMKMKRYARNSNRKVKWAVSTYVN